MLLLPKMIGDRVLFCERCGDCRWHNVQKLNSIFDIPKKESWVFYEKQCTGIAAPRAFGRSRQNKKCFLITRLWVVREEWHALVHKDIY